MNAWTRSGALVNRDIYGHRVQVMWWWAPWQLRWDVPWPATGIKVFRSTYVGPIEIRVFAKPRVWA